jgi:Fe2+ or Zn2+ uptake regulation protein
MVRNSRNTKQKELIKAEIAKISSFFTAVESGELYSYTCNRRTIYSKGKKSHCHFECEKTGKIIHFDIDNIDFFKDKIPGDITSFQLEVKGICKECN